MFNADYQALPILLPTFCIQNRCGSRICISNKISSLSLDSDTCVLRPTLGNAVVIPSSGAFIPLESF